MTTHTLPLRRVDLTKRVRGKGAGLHEHPDIVEGRLYLIRDENGDLHLGRAWHRWFGWTFDLGWAEQLGDVADLYEVLGAPLPAPGPL